MVEVNPQEVPSESKEIDTNVFVAQTISRDGDDGEPAVLPSEESWLSVRTYSADELKDADIDGLPEGHVVFAEMHNLSRDVSIELLRMVISTLEDGEEMKSDQMFKTEDEDAE